MTPDTSVVQYLNAAILRETKAIVHYTVHASMQDTLWGLHRFAGETMARAQDEMGHLDSFTDRLAELDGALDTTRDIGVIQVGSSPLEHMQIVLVLEQEAIDLYNAAVAECQSAGDNDSRKLFEDILAVEVDHYQYGVQAVAQAELMTLSNWISQLV